MIIKNKLLQPLTLHLKSGKGLHLAPKVKVEVPDNEMCFDIKNAENKGFVSVQLKTNKPKTTKPESKGDEK